MNFIPIIKSTGLISLKSNTLLISDLTRLISFFFPYIIMSFPCNINIHIILSL